MKGAHRPLLIEAEALMFPRHNAQCEHHKLRLVDDVSVTITCSIDIKYWPCYYRHITDTEIVILTSLLF